MAITTPTKRTEFTKILPFEKVFSQDIMDELAYQQLFPEVSRERATSLKDLGRSLAMSGAYRTGLAPRLNQQIMNEYLRKLKEQSSEFTGQIKDWVTDWYNQQSEAYYKNPSGYVMPTLPTLEEYAAARGLDLTPGVSGSVGGTTSKNVIGRTLQPLVGGQTPAGGTKVGDIYSGWGYRGPNLWEALKNISALSQAY